jgi:energy-coupling factor transporter ATP-binding protein EcfA2
MIEKLKLRDFGKFKDREFEFKPITVFYGPNESGKSTLFDALTQSLCVLRGKQTAFERYGDQHLAEASFSPGGELKFDSTEFFGFYAIKSDTITVPLDGNGKWLERVKNSFFSGGANPEVIITALDKALNSTKRKLEEKQTREEAKALRAKVEALQESLRQAEMAKAETARLRVELEAAGAAVKALEARFSGTQRESDERNAARRYREYSRVLAEIEKLKALEAQGKTQDEGAAYRKLLGEAEAAKAKRQGALAQAELSGKRLAELEAKLAAEEREAALRAETLSVSRELLCALERANVVREIRERKPGAASWLGLIIALIACSAFGLGLYALKPSPIPLLALPALGLGVGLLLFFILRREIKRNDDSEAQAALSSARSQWLRRLPGQGPLPGQTVQEAVSFLRSFELEADRNQKMLLEHRQEKAQADAAYASLRRDGEEARSAQARLEDELSRWLRARQAATYEEYLDAVRGSRERESKAQAAREAVQAEAERLREPGVEALASRLKRELEALERDFPQCGKTQDELSQVAERSASQRIEAELAAARERERSLLSRYQEKKALAEKDAALYLSELAAAEGKLRRVSERARADDVRREAETIARSIFEGMAAESTDAFRVLSGAVSEYYREFSGHPAELNFESLDLNESPVPDAGGSQRAAKYLSLGTRDIFVLACRLALAERMAEGEGILVFDEPFKNLDGERVNRALGMIGRFREKNPWQVVFLTKDPAIPERLSSLFPRNSLAIYDLANLRSPNERN